MKIPTIPNPFEFLEKNVNDLYEKGYFIPIMIGIIIILLFVIFRT